MVEVALLFGGEWDKHELGLSMAVLEFHTLLMSSVALVECHELSFSYVVEFNDNVGAEYSAEREVPHQVQMQRVAQRRAELLSRSDVFVLTARVESALNLWADHLSRGRRHVVLREAEALGLRCVELTVSAAARSTDYLFDDV